MKLIKIYDANTDDDLDLTECDDSTQKCETHGQLKYRHYWAMRNRLNFLGTRSKHYRVTGSATGTTYEWIKDQQVINLDFGTFYLLWKPNLSWLCFIALVFDWLSSCRG